jgi:hypothetical protein
VQVTRKEKVRKGREGMEGEAQERDLVEVAYEGAVMVHLDHARVAAATVVSIWWLRSFAIHAKLVSFQSLSSN